MYDLSRTGRPHFFFDWYDCHVQLDQDGDNSDHHQSLKLRLLLLESLDDGDRIR